MTAATIELAPPSPPLPLTPDTLIIWQIALPHDERHFASDLATLSPDEVARARRLLRPLHGWRLAAAHAATRQILASHLVERGLTCAPAEVRLRRCSHGKPALDVPGARSGLSFNLSHSGELALLAVGLGRELGVDLEREELSRDLPAIARTAFSPHERAQLAALPEAEREAAFFRIWSRKEAYIKALGLGLSLALDSFDVSADMDGARLLAARHAGGQHARWRMLSLDVAPGYASALVVEARPEERVRAQLRRFTRGG